MTDPTYLAGSTVFIVMTRVIKYSVGYLTCSVGNHRVRLGSSTTFSSWDSDYNRTLWLGRSPLGIWKRVESLTKMLTFTPLSGAAKSERTSPLAYLLQVDDINILLDCGSPDWCPESHSSTTEGDGDATENHFHWERYCDKLRECVANNCYNSRIQTACDC
jgi:hypothetical protein